MPFSGNIKVGAEKCQGLEMLVGPYISIWKKKKVNLKHNALTINCSLVPQVLPHVGIVHFEGSCRKKPSKN